MFADSTQSEKGKFKIIDEENNQSQDVKAPKAVMNSIVKQLYGEMVILEGTQKGNTIELVDVYPAS